MLNHDLNFLFFQCTYLPSGYIPMNMCVLRSTGNEGLENHHVRLLGAFRSNLLNLAKEKRVICVEIFHFQNIYDTYMCMCMCITSMNFDDSTNIHTCLRMRVQSP